MPEFKKLIEKQFKIELFNDQDKPLLNDQCGADFVKT